MVSPAKHDALSALKKFAQGLHGHRMTRRDALKLTDGSGLFHFDGNFTRCAFSASGFSG